MFGRQLAAPAASDAIRFRPVSFWRQVFCRQSAQLYPVARMVGIILYSHWFNNRVRWNRMTMAAEKHYEGKP